ncbi:MAG: CotH kinase family protein [Bacteroidia bacterium]|nr:CotH kinase family protein [Bacteroidia bacterium]
MKALASIALLSIFTFCACETADNSTYLPDTGEVAVLDVWIPQEYYSSLLSNRWSNEKAPARIFVGETSYSGTFEPQGAGSRYHARWSYKLQLDAGQQINGMNTCNLSAQVFDRTMLRSKLATMIFEGLGFPSFNTAHVFLRINGTDKGLLLQVERVEEEFFRKRGMMVYELIKASFGARFSFSENMHLDKYFSLDIPESGNLNSLGEMIEALDTAPPDRIPEVVGRHLDITNYLRYHAAASILNHIDGFANNMLFYKPTPISPYQIIPWDFDKLLAEDADVGLTGDNDIIRALLRNDSCVAIYKREAKNMLASVIVPGQLFPQLEVYQAAIAAAWALDPKLGLAGFSLQAESAALRRHLIERRDFFLRSIDTLTTR